MQEPTVNRFYRGLDSDTSLTERSQDVYLNGHNIRLVRREEGTLWAANIKSTEETFQLREGHIPLGSVEFDGFLFIASVNPNTGLGELGSFPSYSSGGILERKYRAFQNFTTQDLNNQVGVDCLLPESTELDPLATNALGFDCKYPILMLARLDFDGSVNLYFTDNLNPWRVINCGFILETGEPNGRYVTEAQIENGFVNGINENEKHPIVSLDQLTTGGSLRVGNYFFFVRYTDINFSSTSFLGQSGPIPVFNTLSLGVPIPFGGEEISITDKAVQLRVDGLDTTANFIEVGFVRYYAEDNFDTFLIDKRYSVNSSPFVIVNVTGNEPLVPITLDELVAYKPSDALICKTMEHLGNQLYLGNTRGPQLDHPDLRKFMCALTLSEGYTNNGRAPEIRNDRNDNPYSNDANDTEEKVGYFSGEAYIFGAVPVFKNGFVGLPYPVTGYDNYNGLGANPNKSGIYRFRKAQLAPYYDGDDTSIKSIKVNTVNAQSVYNNSQWLQDNLVGIYIVRGERNKVLLYQGLSLRCYNGRINPKIQLRNRQFNHYPDDVNAPIITWDGDVEDWTTDRVVPLFEPASYSMCSNRENNLPITLGATGNFAYYYYAPPYELEGRNDFTDPSRLGIYSLDYFLDKVDVPDTAYVQMVGTTRYETDWIRESTGKNAQAIYNTNALYKYTGQVDGLTLINDTDFTVNALQNPIIPIGRRGHAPTFVGYNQDGISYEEDGFSSSMVNVLGWQVNPTQGFASRFEEGRIASQDGLYYFQRNALINNAGEYDISLPFAVPDYIGVVNAPTYNPEGTSGSWNHYADKWDRAIVNVCRTNPASLNYLDLYDFKNTEFYNIGNFQDIDSFLSQSEHEYFRGDCLVQRQYLKIAHGSIENLSDTFLDVIAGNIPANEDPLLDIETNNGASAPDDLLEGGYGHWISIVVEARYNANYRHELGRNLFYPKTNVNNPGVDFAWLFDSPESPFYNRGYLRMLGPRAGIGIDLLQPTSNNKFPTRIRPSLTHIFGAIRDGYRQFIPADAKDFDYKFGEINVLMSNFDQLYSFQERAINIHPVNERVTQQGTEGSTAILGQSTGLTQYRRIVSDRYGVQHRFAVVKANAGLYAIDWNKRSFLRVAGPQVQVLDVEKRFQTWFRNIIAQGSSGYSDVLDVLPDQHSCNKGIHGAYNRKYKEVIFTLRLGEVDYTVVFSELADAMYGTHGYKPIHYAMVEEDLYSFIDNRGWLHDKGDTYDTFYDEVDEWRVRFVTNEGANITNHWDRQILSSNNRRFKSIAYETQHQTALQDPFINDTEFWYAPTYRENSWRLPIRRADSTKEQEENIYNDFGESGTPLRGRYLITELTYDEDKELWLREVITFKTQSFV